MAIAIFNQLAEKKAIEQTMASLKSNGINAFLYDSEEEAKNKILELVPSGSEVMEMTSVTLDSLGIGQLLRDSKKYVLIKDKLNALDRAKDHRKIQQIGAAPQITIGSVHAVTQDGKVFIASATGSQLPAYVYGADKVIWVVGTQKIVKDADEAMKRIYEYTLPLESERAKKAYGVEGSFVSKLLMIHKEFTLDRITLIFVNKNLGF